MPTATAAPRRFSLRPWMVVAGLCLIFLAVILAHYHAGAREFIWPTPDGTAGYDGQFTYFIALDPANAAPHLDAPAYRYQRILQPLLVRLLSLGQEPLIPWMIVLTDLIALAAGTAILEQLLIAEHASRWFAITYGLFGGIFFAVRVGTTEPLAYALALAAILAGQRKWLVWQAVLLALAALTKETTLFFVAGYALAYGFERRWRDTIRLVVIAVMPFLLWQIVLWIWLGQPGIGSGGAMATPFEIIPFNGIWRTIPYRLFVPLGVLAVAFAMLPTVWALWRGLWDVIRRGVRQHPYVWLLLANAAIMPFVPFSTYREPLGIARFLPGLVIGVLLYAALRKSRRALMYSILWIFMGVVFLA